MALVEAPVSPSLANETGEIDESECLWCSTPLGRERLFGVLYPEVGIVGFVHMTGCAASYAALLAVSPIPPRLIEVA